MYEIALEFDLEPVFFLDEIQELGDVGGGVRSMRTALRLAVLLRKRYTQIQNNQARGVLMKRLGIIFVYVLIVITPVAAQFGRTSNEAEVGVGLTASIFASYVSANVSVVHKPEFFGIGGGAKAMIEDGLFEQFPCDTLYAMHNAPGLPVGKFGAVGGVRTAAGAFYDINIVGKGAHGAFPDQSVDPVIIASELVGALQSIVSRNLRPSETAVVSVTQIHAGDAYNVIPTNARLAGTVRCFSMSVMQKIEARMTELAEGIAAGHGGKAEVDFRTIVHPVVNDPAVSTYAGDICGGLVGNDSVVREGPPGTGSEDFSFMSEVVPSCYLILGNGSGSTPLHNPDYDFNDDALIYGASFFAKVVEETLAPAEA